MAGLRECDIEFDDALRAFEEVSAAVLTGLRRSQSSNDNVTSELSVASTPVDDSDDNKSADEQIPEQLQDFYDAVMQVRFMQERLVDLNAERDEQIVRRDLLIDQEVDLDQTDEEFNQSWDAEFSVAQGNLDEAESALQSAYAACKEADITIPVLQSEGALGHSENLHPEPYMEEEHLSGASIESELAASASSLPVTPGSGPKAENKIAQWVASVEQNPTIVSHLGAHTTRSEPGGVNPDRWKASANRALNSDLYAQRSSHFNFAERQDRILLTTAPTSANLAEPSLLEVASMASRKPTDIDGQQAFPLGEPTRELPAPMLSTNELLGDNSQSKEGCTRTSDDFSGDGPLKSGGDAHSTQVYPSAMISSGCDVGTHTGPLSSSEGRPAQERNSLASTPPEWREQSERVDLISPHDTEDVFLREMGDLEYEVIPPFMNEESFHEGLKRWDRANNLKATTVDSGLGSSILTATDAGLYTYCTNPTFFG
jgi:hypothetical protein